MSLHAKGDLRVSPDLEALSRAVAESVIAVGTAAVTKHGWFSLALSGGQTPRPLYEILARDYQKRLPWPRVEVFWVDERYLSHRDPRSNYGMARESWLANSPIPRENIHPMPTDLPDPDEAASQYERVLRAHFMRDWPRFDLVLLGLGAECHTASLFPHSQALTEDERWVVAVEVPAEPPQRLSLTLPVINHAAHAFFLVSGAEKAEALRRATSDHPEAASCPASGVQPIDGELVWWVDEAARGPL